jgi:hypothetical protein
MNKQQAGRKGGHATVAKHGRAHMQKIGKAGAAVTWNRYQLSPVGWAMVNRETGEVTQFINYIPDRR